MLLCKLRQGKGKQDAVAKILQLDDSRSWDISITEKRWKRSISQNNLYWLWLACLEDFTGQEKDELHEYFKAKFLGFEETEIFGQILTKVVSTASRDTKQFKEYLDRIQVFASVELGIALPNPEDKYWSEFYNTYRNQL